MKNKFESELGDEERLEKAKEIFRKKFSNLPFLSFGSFREGGFDVNPLGRFKEIKEYVEKTVSPDKRAEIERSIMDEPGYSKDTVSDFDMLSMTVDRYLLDQFKDIKDGNTYESFDPKI